MHFGPWAKVKEQSHLERSRSEIVQKLPLIVGIQHFRGLHLHHHAIIDDQIHAVARDDDTIVQHWDENFPSNRMPTTAQLQNESPNVDILEKAKSELVVDGEERIDDRL